MAKNDIQSLPPTDLTTLCRQILSALDADPGRFSIPGPERAALLAASVALEEENVAIVDAEAAYRSAVRRREAARVTAAGAAAQVARMTYAVPTNTPDLIAELGLKPHSTSRARIQPSTPVELTATPQVGGAILLKWNRFRNPAGVNFVVESRTEAGDWRFVQDTTATRLEVTGYAPGIPVAFRVSASKNKTTSPPSAAVTVWPASSSFPALRLAA